MPLYSTFHYHNHGIGHSTDSGTPFFDNTAHCPKHKKQFESNSLLRHIFLPHRILYPTTKVLEFLQLSSRSHSPPPTTKIDAPATATNAETIHPFNP